MFDLHVHTIYSMDGNEEPKKIIKYLKKMGFKGMAVVDHSTLKGAFEAKKHANDFIIIPGMEIKTDKGHILAIGIEEEVKSNRADEVVEEIREKGGISILAHPFRFSKPCIKTDAIEAMNGRNFPWQNKKAIKYAKEKNMPTTAGSDGHYLWEMGRIYMKINAGDAEEAIHEILNKNVEIGGKENFIHPIKCRIYSFFSSAKRGFKRVR